MPIHKDFTARDWLALLSPFALGLDSALREGFRDVLNAVIGVAKAFPNVWKMADIFVEMSTSLIGRALAIPFRGLEEALLTQFKRWGVHNRLIRLDDATKVFFRSWEELVQTITMTDSTGLLGLIIAGLATRLYRFFKASKLLWILVRAWREEQFVAAVLSAWNSKIWRLWYLLVIGLILLAGTAIGAMLFFIGIGIQVLNGQLGGALLPQDSKRVWRKKGGVSRSNARRGPDNL